MEYFDRFVSNTLAGSGNQFCLKLEDAEKIRTGRVYYKIFSGGAYHYSLLFSNIIDSTYSEGQDSRKNIVCDQWYIESLRLGICDDCNCEEMIEPAWFIPLTFQGKASKTVMPGEFFCTDEVLLDVKKDQYICLEMAFRGKEIPHHPETRLPMFLLEDGQWVPSQKMPVPGMIGCDRKVNRRIAFLGDSITQGIGPAMNSYAHWNAVLAELLGEEDSYWNLGLGYGRADDAASEGPWIFKAKQADVVFVCFGVNDIYRGFAEDVIIRNLRTIVERLDENGVQVIVQTIPPFNYDEPRRPMWERINTFIREELGKNHMIFDTVPVLGDKEKGLNIAKYGGHPDEEGSLLWGKALYKMLKENNF